ncbi:DUF401 family protein [Promethearchaeum syntrophicum]|uniref:DUF401 family protein n=1 Tax=Promethearchaeum syntrophicum TaxID=2594042 RepID=A0A5B9D9Y8_9ARCH|nr:DUF401 family protein [Candidatus Prometheoarchaeum syntrophicum]QEE15560.1 hypothetical protein DSAG12_01386 [Candidatus Prometheoarchaeum syntrophicum]
MLPPFVSFIIILILILVFSKYELGIILLIGAILFGLLAEVDLFTVFANVFLDPSVILLAIAVTLIPILGAIMEESKMMLELIEKLNISKKSALMLSPALFGLLPVAGGALMSAPIVDQVDNELDVNKKVAINVWFRHVFILIYPLASTIIVSSVLTQIPLYTIVLVMLVPFFLMTLLGYIFLIRSIPKTEKHNHRDLKRAFRNFIPIIIAPIIDLIGRSIWKEFEYEEIFLVIGLFISLIIGLRFADYGLKSLFTFAKKMKVWRFPLLIIAMFLFLEVFIESGVPDQIASVDLPLILFLILAFILGFATGRAQLPLTILIPIYLTQYGLTVFPLLEFALLYSVTFLGYIITPLHPCVSYTYQYFKTDYKSAFKYLALPTFISFAIALLLSLITFF